MVFNREITLHFLSSHKTVILSKWKEGLRNLSEGYIDYYEEDIEKILNLLMKHQKNTDNTDTYNDDMLKDLGEEIASNRIKQLLNMDIFFSTASKGRSIIIDQVLTYKASQESLSGMTQQVNSFFDKLIYYALSSFTDLKTKQVAEVAEQYQLINPNHKDRLTLLGQMTSSFVHEFRNPLTSIMGFIQLLQAEQPEIKYLDIISKELDQLNYRITQFLNISKKETPTSLEENFSINHLINEVIEFLYPSILDVKATITCNIEDDFEIVGSKEEFRQVLLNIILNALDVVAEVPKPSINISVSQSAGILTLNISNNGPKIPDDVLPNIFDPFITTKKSGTGLGLFVCKEIILKHQGSLTCQSTDFVTTFSINVMTPL